MCRKGEPSTGLVLLIPIASEIVAGPCEKHSLSSQIRARYSAKGIISGSPTIGLEEVGILMLEMQLRMTSRETSHHIDIPLAGNVLPQSPLITEPPGASRPRTS